MDCPSGFHWDDSYQVCVQYATANMHHGHNIWFWVLLGVGILLLLGLLLSIFFTLNQYERGVILRFGKFVGVRQPGLRAKMPFIDKVITVDLRTITLALEPQQAITKDNVSVNINAVAYYQVTDPEKNVVNIDDDDDAIQNLAQSIIRKTIGQQDLESLLEHGDEVATSISSQLENATTDWGLQIQRLELKDIGLDESMIRALAAKAEAQRIAAAKIIASKGELDSAENLKKAAALLDPTGLRLRELETLREIGADNATVIVMEGQAGRIAAESAAGAKAAGLSA